MSEPVTRMSWIGDTYTAPDGRKFAIFSEHVRGEPRYYWAKERIGGGWGPTIRGSENKRTVRRAVERYVRETTTDA